MAPQNRDASSRVDPCLSAHAPVVGRRLPPPQVAPLVVGDDGVALPRRGKPPIKLASAEPPQSVRKHANQLRAARLKLQDQVREITVVKHTSAAQSKPKHQSASKC